jgi:hypothetical protein
VAALGVVLPLTRPGWFVPPAAASPLSTVASVAATRPALTWLDGQFLHVHVESRQETPAGEGGTPAVHSLMVTDNYYTPDGWTWSHRVDQDGRVEDYLFGPGSGWMRPGYAATMPTEPHALDLFLRARTVGSSSQDEAVFVAIGDMLKAEAATPELRAAAIRVLALNPHVHVTNATDSEGRAALVVKFVDEAARAGETQVLYLDPTTGDALGEAREMSSDGTNYYRAVVTVREVVSALPAELAKSLGTDKVVKVGPGASPYATPVDPTPVPSQTYSPPPLLPNPQVPVPTAEPSR